MPLYLTTTCETCGSTIGFSNKSSHVCYWERNAKDPNTKLNLNHQTHNKRTGDMCYCGGNPDCRKCGGSGRITS